MPSRRDLIHSSLERFLEGVVQLGGDGNLSFAEPLAEKALPASLPPLAAEVFTTVSGHIEVEWSLNDEMEDSLPRAWRIASSVCSTGSCAGRS